jgi:hypothetical protein
MLTDAELKAARERRMAQTLARLKADEAYEQRIAAGGGNEDGREEWRKIMFIAGRI